ncbi:MAG: hypothetical protein JWQ44_1676 [Chthoniobacter sp.]|nr:hypothetical protein [Chthoniobacter sp.]
MPEFGKAANHGPPRRLHQIPGDVFWVHLRALCQTLHGMQTFAWWRVFALTLLLPAAAFAQKKAPMQSEDLEHMREELGVNEFTAPAIDLVFEELAGLKPIPFDKVWRDLPDAAPQDRARLAMAAGSVIADGFLAVSAEKQSRIEPVGRVLLKLAKGLGVGDRVTKHSRVILEKSAKQQWADVRKELTRAQADVEAAMISLKDEELAHLVALGGWLRGLEMTASIVVEEYTPERARRLIQPELMDYFLDRVGTLNPNLKKTKLGQTLSKNLQEAKTIITKRVDAPIDLDEVKRIRELAGDINKLIGSPEE